MALLVGCKGAGSTAPASTGELKTDEEKTLYAMGVMLGSNVKPMALTADQVALLNAAPDEVMSQPVRALVELTIGDCLAVAHQGGRVRGFGRPAHEGIRQAIAHRGVG